MVLPPLLTIEDGGPVLSPRIGPWLLFQDDPDPNSDPDEHGRHSQPPDQGDQASQTAAASLHVSNLFSFTLRQKLPDILGSGVLARVPPVPPIMARVGIGQGLLPLPHQGSQAVPESLLGVIHDQAVIS